MSEMSRREFVKSAATHAAADSGSLTLAWVARALPTTHVLALLRYGVLDHTGAGLHDIWGMTSTTTDAALSLLVLAGWAILITAVAIRVFTRSAVN